MKKSTAVILISAAVILAVIVILFPDSRTYENEPQLIPAATVSQRISFFASHGWEVEEVSVRDIVIPAEFTGEYAEYAEIQRSQHLPLDRFKGHSGKIYIYNVKNYSPESHKMLAELIVCDDTAAASLVYSEDGGSIRLSVI